MPRESPDELPHGNAAPDDDVALVLRAMKQADGARGYRFLSDALVSDVLATAALASVIE
jgi:hypothetical protein